MYQCNVCNVTDLTANRELASVETYPIGATVVFNTNMNMAVGTIVGLRLDVTEKDGATVLKVTYTIDHGTRSTTQNQVVDSSAVAGSIDDQALARAIVEMQNKERAIV